MAKITGKLTISQAMSLCHKHGTIVYPSKGFVVRKRKNTEPFTYKKMPDDLNQALTLTYLAEAKRLQDGN